MNKHVCYSKGRLFYLVAVLVIVLIGSTATSKPKVANAELLMGSYQTKTAYKVDVAFKTWGGLNWHYGAFFTGGWGRNQHYVGPGGDAATCVSGHGCISTWNWHGSALSTLLIPKSWYLLGSDEKNPNHYRADMWFD